MQQRDRAAEEGPEKKPKCCLGALYFSEARYGAQKPPVSSPGARVQQTQLYRGGRARQCGQTAWVQQPLLPPPPVALPVSRLTVCTLCVCVPALPPTLFQVCTGFAKRLKPTDDAAQLPTDSVPGGDFKCDPRCSCSTRAACCMWCTAASSSSASTWQPAPPANQQLNVYQVAPT
jgi:hypothetical protein